VAEGEGLLGIIQGPGGTIFSRGRLRFENRPRLNKFGHLKVAQKPKTARGAKARKKKQVTPPYGGRGFEGPGGVRTDPFSMIQE
jgi:hypothetical protein